MVYTETSNDVEHSFKENKYIIFNAVSSRTTSCYDDQNDVNHIKLKKLK